MDQLRAARLLHQRRSLIRRHGAAAGQFLLHHVRQDAAHVRHQLLPLIDGQFGVDAAVLLPFPAAEEPLLRVKGTGDRLTQRVRQQGQRRRVQDAFPETAHAFSTPQLHSSARRSVPSVRRVTRSTNCSSSCFMP